MNTSGYTYARLQGASGDVWIAATEFDAKVGERVTVSLDLPMEDFDSKTLNPPLQSCSISSRGGPRRSVAQRPVSGLRAVFDDQPWRRRRRLPLAARRLS